MKPIGRLHVLTDTSLQGRFSHAELARLAIAGGADFIQFRHKSGSTRELIEMAGGVQQICRRAGVPLIINDRLDLALAVGSEGVHLGQDDFPLAQARRILGPGSIIGGSADSLAQARLCQQQGADYVGLGPVFPTTSKDDAGEVVGLAGLKEVVAALDIPVIAIGGVEAANAKEVMAAGAHGIAVISAVCCQEDPLGAARALRRAMT